MIPILIFGQTARETILNGSTALTFCEQIAEKLGITYLLDRFFIKLSTGETRKRYWHKRYYKA